MKELENEAGGGGQGPSGCEEALLLPDCSVRGGCERQKGVSIDIDICPVARVNAQVRVVNSAFCEEVLGAGPLNLWSGRGRQWH